MSRRARNTRERDKDWSYQIRARYLLRGGDTDTVLHWYSMTLLRCAVRAPLNLYLLSAMIIWSLWDLWSSCIEVLNRCLPMGWMMAGCMCNRQRSIQSTLNINRALGGRMAFNAKPMEHSMVTTSLHPARLIQNVLLSYPLMCHQWHSMHPSGNPRQPKFKLL